MIILARHGRSRYNDGLTDDLDSDLTSNGKMQAEELGQYINKLITSKYSEILDYGGHIFGPDEVIVYHSEYKRTKQTAEILSDQLDQRITVNLIEDIRIGEHRYRGSGYTNKYDWETDKEFVSRLDEFISKREFQYYHWPKIIISHGTPVLTMYNILMGKKERGYWGEPKKVGNCESFIFI